jgi:3',5'-nucleoside bisphosphate phosphatase
LIDLHTHTTASDGRYPPAQVVDRARLAGVRVLSITDHDTVAGSREGAAACAAAGIEFVPGIEITAVRDEVDVHVLGYFLDADSPRLATFLAEQRRHRIARLREMVDRLGEVGIALDAQAILRPALEDQSKAVGRPWIARALVARGYASTVSEAFDRWLGKDRPAFVPRVGAAVEDVIGRIHDAGGVASVAHPGLLDHDDWLPGLVDAGLDAIEAYHTDHPPPMTARYLALADALGVAVTGGSDYHGDDLHGGAIPGSVPLPRDAYDRLVDLSRLNRLKPHSTL